MAEFRTDKGNKQSHCLTAAQASFQAAKYDNLYRIEHNGTVGEKHIIFHSQNDDAEFVEIQFVDTPPVGRHWVYFAASPAVISPNTKKKRVPNDYIEQGKVNEEKLLFYIAANCAYMKNLRKIVNFSHITEKPHLSSKIAKGVAGKYGFCNGFVIILDELDHHDIGYIEREFRFTEELRVLFSMEMYGESGNIYWDMVEIHRITGQTFKTTHFKTPHDEYISKMVPITYDEVYKYRDLQGSCIRKTEYTLTRTCWLSEILFWLTNVKTLTVPASIEYIPNRRCGLFNGLAVPNTIETVVFGGTKMQWAKLELNEDNDLQLFEFVDHRVVVHCSDGDWILPKDYDIMQQQLFDY